MYEPWDEDFEVAPVAQVTPVAPSAPSAPSTPTRPPIEGIPAVIGTDEDFPLTSRSEYLGQSRDSVIEITDKPTTLDPLQIRAINDARNYQFTNISGTAGVGKTFVAKEIVKACPGTVLAATTGIASVNLGEGTTINALLRYFDTTDLKTKYTNGILQAMLRKLRRAGVQRILIDEKSMMAGEQLTFIARAVREVNEGGIYALEQVGMTGSSRDDDDYGVGENEDDPNPLPTRREDLPPMGITLVGDFGQLPPVPDEIETIDPKTGEKKCKKLPIQYAFDSPEWPLFAEHTTRLEKIYRQDAADFVAALHAVRRGDVRKALEFFTANRFSPAMDDAYQGATVFAKNDQVERHNNLMLDKLTGPVLVNRTTRMGKPRGDWKQIPDELRLKENALVMILANRRKYEDEFDDTGKLIYANGDLGELVGKDSVGWLVRLKRTGRVVTVYPVRREHVIPLEPGRRKEIREQFMAGTGPAPEEIITEQGKGKSEIIGSIVYMPLRAAYGCTVHKTQGLTLDAVQVNINDYFFKTPGMLFVALSRARTAEGLRIVGSQRGFVERCQVEPRVQPWL